MPILVFARQLFDRSAWGAAENQVRGAPGEQMTSRSAGEARATRFMMLLALTAGFPQQEPDALIADGSDKALLICL